MSETTCPVFYPTIDEFKEFYKYVQHIESTLPVNQHGICKIVPPEGWYAKEYNMDEISKLIVKTPVRQVISILKAGVFNANLFELKKMNVQTFIDFAKTNRYQSDDYVDREKKFWRNLGSTSSWSDPIYGADSQGSLFNGDACSWNLNTIDSLLRLLDSPVPGVTNSMLYVGTWRSMFAFHVEDVNLYSINYVHIGDSKSWYSVSAEYKRRFESMSDSFNSEDQITCPEYLRHKTKLFSPNKLKEFGIPYSTAVQKAGEFIITFPGAYHAGFNHGFNIAEATNFATPLWLEMGRQARVCMCMPWSVTVDVERLETLYYRDLVANKKSRYSYDGLFPGEDESDKSSLCPRSVCHCKRRAVMTLEDSEDSVWYLCKHCMCYNHSICAEQSFSGLASTNTCILCHLINEEQAQSTHKRIKLDSQYRLEKVLSQPSRFDASVKRPINSPSTKVDSSLPQKIIANQIDQTTRSISLNHIDLFRTQSNALAVSKCMEGNCVTPNTQSQTKLCITPFQLPVSAKSSCSPFSISNHSLYLSPQLRPINCDLTSQVSGLDTHSSATLEEVKRVSKLPININSKKTESILKKRSEVYAKIPGYENEHIGVLVNINGKFGRFHEKGTRKEDDIWLPLTAMRIKLSQSADASSLSIQTEQLTNSKNSSSEIIEDKVLSDIFPHKPKALFPLCGAVQPSILSNVIDLT